MSYYVATKQIGQTMGELILDERKKNSNHNIAFAGRLDPMAYGNVIILRDNYKKRQTDFMNCKKEYTVKMVFGFTSDTLDILSSNLNYTKPNISNENIDTYILKIKNIINKKYIGDQLQNFPIFSSKTVKKNGKMEPMWKVYKEDPHFFTDFNIPNKKIYIDKLNIMNYEFLDSDYAKSQFINDLEKISDTNTGLSKMEAIDFFKNLDIREQICILNLNIIGSSGTYVRQLIHDISNDIQIPALSWRIYRTKYVI